MTPRKPTEVMSDEQWRLWERLRIWMDEEGCLHIDRPEDMPQFLAAIVEMYPPPPDPLNAYMDYVEAEQRHAVHIPAPSSEKS